ncbi:MAG TPA: type I phosphomannose isomerase catalytic subunit [Cytophagaceae bacterium]|nr:type I phosphomannose isomerase catalytic subunit [Cytophagaceae bacterium]
MSLNYPLRFKTIFKEKIWGGQKIKDVLGKDFFPLVNCGETWELSAVQGNVSEVVNGLLKGKDLQSLCTDFSHQLLGEKVAKEYGTDFPLLIKYIDANDDLSVQVHPDDKLAKVKHGCKGKTEMWYIMQTDEGAVLNSGFAKVTTKEEYAKAIAQGNSLDYLNFEKVKSGDVFFMPAGRIHYIGKGIMLAEIQQTSDITYRIYDFDRKDDQGNKRELHVKDGVEALDFTVHPEYKTPYVTKDNGSAEIIRSQFFNTNIIDLKKAHHYGLPLGKRDSFTILICVEGNGKVEGDFTAEAIKPGDVLLVPASLKHVVLTTNTGVKVLEVFI